MCTKLREISENTPDDATGIANSPPVLLASARCSSSSSPVAPSFSRRVGPSFFDVVRSGAGSQETSSPRRQGVEA